MDEANKFSKEVTTKGDKGIEDHIESCKVGEGDVDGLGVWRNDGGGEREGGGECLRSGE